MHVSRPSAAALASALTAAVLAAVPAGAARAAVSADPAAPAGAAAPADTADTTGTADTAGTAPTYVSAPVDLASAVPDSATTVCGTYGTMNAYVWASDVRVHTGPSESNTAIGECGPSWVHADCQLQGGEVVYGAYRNNWWVFAETHVGNFYNGYISDVFIAGGGNDAPVPGIPVCS